MMESESPAIVTSLHDLPPEMLFLLFEYISPKDVVTCRRVCSWWRDIIDAYLTNNKVWERFCQRDYKTTYLHAMNRTPNITSWFEMYRSLSVWSQLPLAVDSVEELCSSNKIYDEIRNIAVQEHGVVMVHKRKGVFFHEIETLREANRKGFSGQYKTVLELDDMVLMLGLNSQLHLVKKRNPGWSCDLAGSTSGTDELKFHNVQTFLVGDRTLYYYTHTQGLFSFHFDIDSKAQHINLKNSFYESMTPPLLGAWGYKNGCLYIISMSENMYIVYGNGHVRQKYSLSSVNNLMDCMYRHNMLDNVDWRQYYILHSDLKHHPHTGLLRSISAIKIHRDDIFFVATQSVVTILIYYKPFHNGQLNLGAFKPMRMYNLTEHAIARPLQTAYMVVANIEVIETKEGHKVLVCLQGKILVYTFRHDFGRPLYTTTIEH